MLKGQAEAFGSVHMPDSHASGRSIKTMASIQSIWICAHIFMAMVVTFLFK